MSGKRHHDRGDGDDAGEDVDPAREPGVPLAGQVLGPLEDRSGDREVARDLGEVERHDELARCATMGQLQMNTPPSVSRPRENRVKMPVEGEM